MNFYVAFKNIIIYNNAKPYFLSQLNVMNTLIKMTEEEISYKNKPTSFNALLLMVQSNLIQKEELEIQNEVKESPLIDEIENNPTEFTKNNLEQIEELKKMKDDLLFPETKKEEKNKTLTKNK